MSPAFQITLAAEAAHIRQSLETLRTLFPKGTPDMVILNKALNPSKSEPEPQRASDTESSISSDALRNFMRSKRRATTKEIMAHFKCSAQKAAGSIARLRRLKVLRVAESVDGSSGWAFSR